MISKPQRKTLWSAVIHHRFHSGDESPHSTFSLCPLWLKNGIGVLGTGLIGGWGWWMKFIMSTIPHNNDCQNGTTTQDKNFIGAIPNETDLIAFKPFAEGVFEHKGYGDPCCPCNCGSGNTNYTYTAKILNPIPNGIRLWKNADRTERITDATVFTNSEEIIFIEGVKKNTFLPSSRLQPGVQMAYDSFHSTNWLPRR
jgi:hypothetical protein